MVGIWTSQGIQLLGMPTEAIHTPFMSDRYLSIENARYIFNNMKNIGDEVEFKEGGLIRKRAKEVWTKLPHFSNASKKRDSSRRSRRESSPTSNAP